MASKYQKLAIAPDGSIVFRTTGRLVTKIGLTVTDNRVYANGRLYGYLGKATKAQQAQIEKTAKGREKRHQAEIRKRVKEFESEGVSSAPAPATSTPKQLQKWFKSASLSADAVAFVRGLADKRDIEVSKVTQSKLNYAKVLENAVKAGKLSFIDADEMYRKMDSAKSDKARIELWHETADLFDKIDYKYKLNIKIKDKENID